MFSVLDHVVVRVRAAMKSPARRLELTRPEWFAFAESSILDYQQVSLLKTLTGLRFPNQLRDSHEPGRL